MRESRIQQYYYGVWSAGGDALTPEEIDRAIDDRIQPGARRLGWAHVGGLDIGLKRDATAVVCLAKSPEGRYQLVNHQRWKARFPGGQVDLEWVEWCILEWRRRYRTNFIAYDPYQGEYLASRLLKAGQPMLRVPFAGENMIEMARSTVEAFSEGIIKLYRDESLIADLRTLRIVENNRGPKLDPQRGPRGHGDSAIALALALAGARYRRAAPPAPSQPRLHRPGYALQ
jgi:hypothetical protein